MGEKKMIDLIYKPSELMLRLRAERDEEKEFFDLSEKYWVGE